MIQCPSCHSTNLKGSQLVEMGVTTVYEVVGGSDKPARMSSARTVPTKVVISQIQNENSSLVLICSRCGAESELPQLTTFVVGKR